MHMNERGQDSISLEWRNRIRSEIGSMIVVRQFYVPQVHVDASSAQYLA